MSININTLTKDTSFKDDDYLLKDGNTNRTRIISVQDAADDLARRSTTVLKRASNYDEALAITETDYIIKDNTTAPARVLASNAATSLAQMATYPDGSNVSDTDYILKINANGKPQKVEASQAAADLAELAGQIAGAEMLEEAIAKGIVDQAMTNAIETTVPQAVQTLRSELSEGEVASQIVDGALTSYAADTLIANTDKFYKRDTDDTATTYVTAKQIVDAGLAAGSSRSRNTLTTTDSETGYVLDARQGRVLNENKIDKTSIADNLTTNDATKVLSAKQGKALQDNKVDRTTPQLYINTAAAASSVDGKLTNILKTGATNKTITVKDGTKSVSCSLGEYGLEWLNDLVTDNVLSLKKTITKLAYMMMVHQIILNGDDFTHLNSATVVRRCGSIVHLFIGSLTGLTAQGETTIFTLPAGFRPTNTIGVNTIVLATVQTDTRRFRINVRPTGDVDVYNYSDSTGVVNIQADITYILAPPQANVEV